MNQEALTHMLLAMRAQIEAMHAEINAALSVLAGPPQEEEPAGCRHPPEARLNTTTLGGPDSWQCLLCGQAHAGPVNQG